MLQSGPAGLIRRLWSGFRILFICHLRHGGMSARNGSPGRGGFTRNWPAFTFAPQSVQTRRALSALFWRKYNKEGVKSALDSPTFQILVSQSAPQFSNFGSFFSRLIQYRSEWNSNESTHPQPIILKPIAPLELLKHMSQEQTWPLFTQSPCQECLRRLAQKPYLWLC